jgi:integrase
MKGKARREDYGSLRKLTSGRWQARWRDDNGKLRAAPNTFANKTDAKIWLASVRTDRERGTFIDPDAGKVTVGALAESWLASARVHLKPKTVAGYESILRTCVRPYIGDRPIRLVRSIDVNAWLAELTTKGLSPSRVRQANNLLSQVMKEAVRSGMIYSNPCQDVRLPRLPRLNPIVIEIDQFRAMVDAAPAPYALFIETLGICGLRFGEAVALRRSRVDLDERRIEVCESASEVGGRLIFGPTKTYETRLVTLPAALVERLRVHIASIIGDGDALVFTGRKGGPIRNSNLRRDVWNALVADLASRGIVPEGITPKALRSSCASWVADQFGPLEAGRRLGHSSTATTTKHYARPMPGRDRDVAVFLDGGKVENRPIKRRA